ncbi:MAG: SHOCT domain-containing protein [Pyrinomonadaceae bacterium]
MIDHGWFGGMHMFWWIFWVVGILLFFALMEAEPRHRARQRRESPLDILKRRYAAGELTTEEYKERKAHLDEDGLEKKSDQM